MAAVVSWYGPLVDRSAAGASHVGGFLQLLAAVSSVIPHQQEDMQHKLIALPPKTTNVLDITYKSSFDVDETCNPLSSMASLSSVIISKGLAPHNSIVFHRHRGNPMISESSHHRQILIGLTMNSSGMNIAIPIKGTTRLAAAVGPGPANPSGGNFPIPNMPPWAKWLVNAIMIAIPLYTRFRTLEEKIEKTAEVAFEVIHTVAEVTEEVVVGAADKFPGNETMKKAASKIKTVMDVIEEDTEKGMTIIHKVDEIKEEAYSIVDPIIDKVTKEKELAQEETDKAKKQLLAAAVGAGAANPSGGNFPIPNLPPWAKWLISAAMIAIPLYTRFRTIEEKIEKTAEVAVEVIDAVAEATETVAVGIGNAFPGNQIIQEATSKIKAVMDVIEEDADKARALIHKVDEITDEVDSMVDPIIDKVTKNES
ncbi:hypothetical protein U9M48_032738 [Paspalum notatum var. saurae]|uniref:Uncharacterized protein n=1 Tax=Paspalum notatum var. saurae TaxID=547442 RepID=A0AAQ3U9A2_PASNO